MGKQISIIIATFNAGKTLQRCLDSIRRQKSEAIELLIIDGGSKDETMQIIKSNNGIVDYSISEKDKGIYDAWNKGIQKASGKWVMFVGADDYLIDNTLMIYLRYLEDHNCSALDLISAKCLYVDEKGNEVDTKGERYNYNIFSRYMNISHGSTLHNIKLFRELGGFNLNYRICADYEFLLRRPLMADFIDEPVLCMQRGGMSDSFAGLLETFRIKQEKKILSTWINLVYLFKGSVGLFYRKFIAKI